MDKVNDDAEILFIRRSDGKDVVIMSADNHESIDATAYLLSTEANRNALKEAIEEEDSVSFKSMKDLDRASG